MDLECPLLRGSSVRRLCRPAATLPLFLERAFPSPVFISSCAEVTAVMEGLMGENKFSWCHHWNRMCCHRSSCETSPSCQKCLHSSEASISATVLKAPVTAGCNYCHVLDWLPPLLQGCWTDWVAGWDRKGAVERLGAAVQIRMAFLVRWIHHWELLFVAQGMQSRKLRAFLFCESLIALSSSRFLASCVAVGLARSRVAPRRIHLNPPNQLKCWRPCWIF